MPLADDLTPCTVCGEPVLWGTRHPVCGHRVMALDLAEMERIANPKEAKQRAAMWAEQDGAGVEMSAPTKRVQLPENAREALRTHLNTALTGAAKDTKC